MKGEKRSIWVDFRSDAVPVVKNVLPALNPVNIPSSIGLIPIIQRSAKFILYRDLAVKQTLKHTSIFMG